MWRARFQDAMAIWDGSPGPWKRQPVMLKAKASICIFMGWEESGMELGDYDSMIAVWFSSQNARWSFDGPECEWQEVAVAREWWRWKYVRYSNGF